MLCPLVVLLAVFRSPFRLPALRQELETFGLVTGQMFYHTIRELSLRLRQPHYRFLRWIGYVSNLSCGSKRHIWAVSVVGGAGLFLTLSKVNGRSLGEQVVFIKTCCYQKTMGETANNARRRQTEIITYVLFLKSE